MRELKVDTILAAAEGVFAADGIHKARMETIAAKAGMAVGTLYNFFTDRSALVDALVDARARALISELETALQAAADLPFAEQVRIYLDTSLAHVEKHGRFWAELMRSQVGHQDKRDSKLVMREQLLVVAQRVIDAGMAQGVLKPEGAAIYAAILVGLMRSVLEHSASGRPCLIPGSGRPEKLSNTSQILTQFFLHGALR